MLKKFLAFSITAIMIFSLSACGNKEAEEKGDYLSGNKWESTAGMPCITRPRSLSNSLISRAT